MWKQYLHLCKCRTLMPTMNMKRDMIYIVVNIDIITLITFKSNIENIVEFTCHISKVSTVLIKHTFLFSLFKGYFSFEENFCRAANFNINKNILWNCFCNVFALFLLYSCYSSFVRYVFFCGKFSSKVFI